MRIGLVADTHLPSLMRSLDELGPEIGDFLSTVELILHAGDVTAPLVLDWLEQYAPVLVSQGNNDLFEDPRMKPVQLLDIDGWRIGMTHELRPESRPIADMLATRLNGEAVDILIGGDTHVDRLEYREDTVLINSGSPNLPHHKETRLGTVALLELERGRLRAEIIVLGHSNGSPNPGVGRHIEIADGRLVAASLNGDPVHPHEFGSVTVAHR